MIEYTFGHGADRKTITVEEDSRTLVQFWLGMPERQKTYVQDNIRLAEAYGLENTRIDRINAAVKYTYYIEEKYRGAE
ncbi:MAG: hypothetical protein AAF847_17200 [Bacteroidota bacterium]